MDTWCDFYTYNTDSMISFADAFLNSKAPIPYISVRVRPEENKKDASFSMDHSEPEPTYWGSDQENTLKICQCDKY